MLIATEDFFYNRTAAGIKILLKFFFFFFFPEVEGKGKHNSHAFSVFWLTCGNNIAHWGAYISFFSLYKIDGLIQN